MNKHLIKNSFVNKSLQMGGVIFIFLFSLIFNACQKEALLNEDISQSFKKEVNNLPVSVDANTLVFETEEDFQTTLDFLNNADAKMLDNFEQTLGYTSFRSTHKQLVGTDNKYEDELFLSMINPDAEIIIAKHLMKVDFETEKTLVVPVDENNMTLKSASSLDFDWDDDVFEYLENPAGYKKWPKWNYCRTNKQKYKEWKFWVDNGTYFRTELKAKVCFQRYGIYNSIIIKFKADKKGGNAPEFNVHYKTADNCFYTKKDNKKIDIDREKRSIFRGPGNVISDRPYNRTKRLKQYLVQVTFDYYYTYAGQRYSDYKTLYIDCFK